MTRVTLEEYAAAVRPRYERARKQEKGRILDEFCETTGLHRKAAIRLLRRRQRPGPARKAGRPVRYGPEVTEALVAVWEAADRMCGKLLVAVMPVLVDGLERHGELRLSPDVRAALLSMSASTIDRRLRRRRWWLGRQPRRASSPASGVKAQVPLRTWSEWQGVRPGCVQADLVLHCGERTEGFFLTTLTVVDVATGWIALQPVWGVGMSRVGGGLEMAARRLPFPLRELHTDNGSEFINRGLYDWCRRRGVRLTRGRSYRKNDQAYVEQRNWLAVRRSVGYDRYSSKAAMAALQRLYALLELQMNFLRPVRKLVGKERHGARVRKRYDTPRTPYERALASGTLDEATSAALRDVAEALNPAELRRGIDAALRALWACSEREERRRVG
ncbi:transposase family protein [Tepidiforma sp.]|uniref:integrase catalytic domain-containing protein n=1 Tax=Tepidiforma sp. TaxID=2682230 RepID=UPI002ADDE777|nr:transposase family protein [Tepidiforma sp.]